MKIKAFAVLFVRWRALQPPQKQTISTTAQSRYIPLLALLSLLFFLPLPFARFRFDVGEGSCSNPSPRQFAAL